MSQVVLQAHGLVKRFGGITATDHVNLSLQLGARHALIGPNGAGKTTLLSAAMGLLRSRGEVRVDGEAVARPSVEALVGRGLALVPEKRELFSTMPVEDNLI